MCPDAYMPMYVIIILYHMCLSVCESVCMQNATMDSYTAMKNEVWVHVVVSEKKHCGLT